MSGFQSNEKLPENARMSGNAGPCVTHAEAGDRRRSRPINPVLNALAVSKLITSFQKLCTLRVYTYPLKLIL